MKERQEDLGKEDLDQEGEREGGWLHLRNYLTGEVRNHIPTQAGHTRKMVRDALNQNPSAGASEISKKTGKSPLRVKRHLQRARGDF